MGLWGGERGRGAAVLGAAALCLGRGSNGGSVLLLEGELGVEWRWWLRGVMGGCRAGCRHASIIVINSKGTHSVPNLSLQLAARLSSTMQ